MKSRFCQRLKQKTVIYAVIGTTGYCLVDFATKKLYTLSDPYSGYFIRDYYVSYNIVENADLEDSHIEVFILYAPERTAS